MKCVSSLESTEPFRLQNGQRTADQNDASQGSTLQLPAFTALEIDETVHWSHLCIECSTFDCSLRKLQAD